MKHFNFSSWLLFVSVILNIYLSFRFGRQIGITQLSSDTSNFSYQNIVWETYSNPDLGYQFIYPQNWSVKANNHNSNIIEFGPASDDPLSGLILITTVTENQSLEEYMFNVEQESDIYFNAKEKTTINGLSGYLVAYSGPNFDGSGAFLKNKNTIYYICYNYQDPDKLSPLSALIDSFKLI